MAAYDLMTLLSSTDDDGQSGEGSATRCKADGETVAGAHGPDAVAGVERADVGGADAEAEPHGDEIRPGVIEKLIVPHEDIGEDIAISEEFSPDEKIKFRKSRRREWIILNPVAVLTTHLLVHKPDPDGMDENYYFVAPPLRSLIRDELKAVRVFPAYSVSSQTHFLLPVKVTPDNSWYDSLQALLNQPPEFFAANEVLIFSDKKKSRYRIRTRPLTHAVEWPATPTQELLGEALGKDRFIMSADHPIYRDLVDGEELS